MIAKLLKNTLRNGAVLTVATTAAILTASANENKGSWGALNSVSHIVDGDEKTYGDEFSPRDSTIGFAINSSAMFAWGMLYDLAFGQIPFPKSLASASIFTAGAYLVDYYIVPKQYTPGIEKKISKNAIFCMYAVIVVTLALSPRWNKR